MSRILKRKYRDIRKDFKQELYDVCQTDVSLPMMIINTYTAWHARRHLLMIYSEIGNKHPAVWRDMSSELVGKQLIGRVDIFHALYLSHLELHDKYYRKIPERFAMGDALGVAYRVLFERRSP